MKNISKKITLFLCAICLLTMTACGVSTKITSKEFTVPVPAQQQAMTK